MINCAVLRNRLPRPDLVAFVTPPPPPSPPLAAPRFWGVIPQTHLTIEHNNLVCYKFVWDDADVLES